MLQSEGSILGALPNIMNIYWKPSCDIIICFPDKTIFIFPGCFMWLLQIQRLPNTIIVLTSLSLDGDLGPVFCWWSLVKHCPISYIPVRCSSRNVMFNWLLLANYRIEQLPKCWVPEYVNSYPPQHPLLNFVLITLNLDALVVWRK